MLLYIWGNNHQTQDSVYRMKKNFQRCCKQRINIKNIWIIQRIGDSQIKDAISEGATEINGHISGEKYQGLRDAQKQNAHNASPSEHCKLKLNGSITLYQKKKNKTTIKMSDNNKYCWGHGDKGTLLYVQWARKLLKPLWKSLRRYLKYLKSETPVDTDIPFLITFSKVSQLWYCRNTLQLPNF